VHGILGCLKHFPGLAASEVDSHEELPQVNVSEGEIRDVDLFPYRKLLNRHPNASVMVAHAAYPKTDLHENDSDGKLLPSSLDRRIVTDLLRAELNFPGVAITDDMEMGAILKNYGIGEACVRAILAGQDMLAICASPQAVREGYATVLGAVNTGRIPAERLEESLKRIAELKQKITPRVAFDPERLAAISDEIAAFNEKLN
jgi:beta-N-acetylhexosaminidase